MTVAAKAEPPPPGNFKKGKGVIGIEYLMPEFGRPHSRTPVQLSGSPAGKRPIKIELKAGKTYAWCACGRSSKQVRACVCAHKLVQPFCDGSHGKAGMPVVKPVRVQLDATQSVMLCTCKQTLNRPYCDGSHKKLPAQRVCRQRCVCDGHVFSSTYPSTRHRRTTKVMCTNMWSRASPANWDCA